MPIIIKNKVLLCAIHFIKIFREYLGKAYSKLLGNGADINIFMNYNNGITDTTSGIAFMGQVCGEPYYK